MESVDWGYAISTLVIRFVGIFVVLGILQVVMQITGRLFSRLDAKKEPRQPRVGSQEFTQEEAAAVAMALYLHENTTYRSPASYS